MYRLDHKTGKLKLEDIIRSELESAPRHLKFSQDGRFLYVVHELKNYIDVYSYEDVNDMPQFEKIQTISTLNDYLLWYREKRIKLSLGGLSPIEYRRSLGLI